MLNSVDGQYHVLMQRILETGEQIDDRTGVGILSIFGNQMRFDLREGFPLITTKKVYFKGVLGELLWFLRGDTNVRWLQQNKIHIWDEWADENGNLGTIYGRQWRNYNGQGVDQIANVIYQIKTNPFSRRLIVSAWNPVEVNQMALPACHPYFQLRVNNRNELSCFFLMRSWDLFLGAPFNIASYALLTHMIAQVCNLNVGELVATSADTHLYLNHIEQVKEQLSRSSYALPQIELNPNITDIDNFGFDDVRIVNYQSHPAISAPVAV